jgi:hypothetical protein
MLHADGNHLLCVFSSLTYFDEPLLHRGPSLPPARYGWYRDLHNRWNRPESIHDLLV